MLIIWGKEQIASGSEPFSQTPILLSEHMWASFEHIPFKGGVRKQSHIPIHKCCTGKIESPGETLCVILVFYHVQVFKCSELAFKSLCIIIHKCELQSHHFHSTLFQFSSPHTSLLNKDNFSSRKFTAR